MNERSAHVDTFAQDRLPPRSQWPMLTFSLPELQYPARINCATQLLDEALKEGNGQRIVVYSEDTAWSWDELHERTDRIAHVLVNELGVVPGNRVLLRGFNSATLVAAWLAVVKAGAIAVTAMPMLRAKELAVIAEKAQIEHALCDHRLLDELQQAAVICGRLRHVMEFGAGELEARMAAQPSTFEPVNTASDDVCLLAFTSGTTGGPKATVHFHRDVLAMADVVGRHLLHTGPDDIYLGTPPLGFTFGLGALLVFPLRFRAATIMLEKPTPEALLQTIEKFGATCLFTAPTMYRNLASLAGQFNLTSLRRCVCAGEPLPQAVADDWHARTGIRLIDGLGSTEMIHIFMAAGETDAPRGAIGRPLPGYEACVLDDANRPVLPGTPGRLAVRGPTGCRYLDDPRQTEYVVESWNVTGDRCVADADGFFWFQGRADDLIVSSGYKIPGPEVESAILAHPGVRECAVIGAPDERRGQIVKAFVVLHADFAATPNRIQALQDFVKATIAPFKYPRAIEVVESLPKTPSGKIQRFVLRQQESERAAAVAAEQSHGREVPPA